MPLSQTATYNLKAVLKETGIAADTLRAWERRYGIPMPERTPGGHRLYSQRDIHLIKWLMARQGEGLSISHAVEMWNELTASGQDPLAASHASGVSGLQALPAASTTLDALRKEWLDACLAYDESTAEHILNQAFALYSVNDVSVLMIQQALHEVGEMWQHVQASVQQEHFVSALAMRRLDSLISATPSPIHSQTILLACPPGELHTLPLLHLNLLLRRRSWNVVFLGANVPIAQLEETAQIVKPTLVVMAAQQLMTAATLEKTVALLVKKGFPVAYGGRVFNQIPELRERIVGEFLGEELDPAVNRIEQLVQEPIKVRLRSEPVINPVAQAYRDSRSKIELTVQQQFESAGLPTRDLATSNGYFGTALAAALDLGNVAYLEADMDWIRVVLAGQNLPVESLRHYLTAYAGAVRQVMGTSAAQVADWLEGYITTI